MQVHILGSANALSYRDRDNTALLVTGSRMILVDCPGSPWQKILKAGEEPLGLFGVYLTHVHADHVYGLPSLVHSLWLGGRKDPLHLWHPADGEQVVRGLLELFGLQGKPGLFPLTWHPLGPTDGTVIWRETGYALTAFTAEHSKPTLGLKVEDRGKSLVYSADTRYNRRLETLAAGVDLLIHECNSAEKALGPHSTVIDVARLIGVAHPRRTLLIHLTEGEPYEETIEKTGRPMELAADGMALTV